MNDSILAPDGREGSIALAQVSLIAVLVASFLVAFLGVLAKPAETQTGCGTVQTRVDAAPAGATVDLPDGCIYREAVTLKKPITLIGGPGTGIRGSDVWGGWAKNASGDWVSNGSVPTFEAINTITDPQHPYPCKDGTERCKWPEQVFLDGKPLLQVASNPQSGQFAVTDARKVLLADDPGGRTVEVTTRARWIEGRSGRVTIEDFTMKHAANGLRNAAIENNGNPNWTIRNDDLSYAHSAILNLGSAASLRIEGSDVHHGGLLGITSSGEPDLEAIDNEIHDNNTEAFYPAWKSAGIKVANASRFVASGNEVYGNDQTGIWVDIGSQNVTVSNNRVHHNVKRGIHLEISDHAEVFGNAVWENGWGTFVGDESGAEGVGISATASRDVEIYNNTLAWNPSGIAVVNSKRTLGKGGSDPKYSTVSDVLVHDNTILLEERRDSHDFALIWRKTYTGGNLYEPAANNRGYDNRYWYTSPEGSRSYRFVWDKRLDGLGLFNGTPGEERGRYLSATEKDQVTATKGVPASPGQGTAPPDEKRPTIALATPPENATYTLDEDVKADYGCADAGGSGLKSCDGPVADGAPIDTSSTGPKSFQVVAEDNAGNTHAVTHSYEVVRSADAVAPITDAVLSQGPNAAGWHKEDVTVNLDATDNQDGSGVDGISYSATGAQQIANQTVQGDSARIPITVEGQTTITYYAKDKAGNAEAEKVFEVKLDKTAPEISIIRPAAGAEYMLNQAVTADYTCSDGGSGVDSCAGPASSGGDVDTASAGSKSFTVRAGDKAGNAATLTHEYAVQSCTISGTSGGDELTGTPNDDVICALEGDDTVASLGGNDTIFGGPGDDIIQSSPGNDTLKGQTGNDGIVDSSGEDDLRGGHGADRLDARDGRGGDKVFGGADAEASCSADLGDTVRACP